ncbi:MAG: hypothetical protein IJ733_18110 [Lachnospiraceae bacterium]|nr:hypothetical protein [Lachnospiraceae bacterium]
MRKSVKKVVVAALAAVVTLAYSLGAAGTVSSAEVSDAAADAAKQDYDASGGTEYHAYFGFQMGGTWIYRDPWYSAELGVDGESLAEAGVTYDDFLRNGDDGPMKIDGTVTDAVIKGNGTYSVKVEGMNGILSTAAGEPNVSNPIINMIYVSTDIPVAARDAGFTISNIKLICDGNETAGVPADPFYPEEYEDTDTDGNGNGGLIRFDAVNTYQTSQGAFPEGITDLQPWPSDSIEIQFDVTGMDVDNADDTAAEPAAGTETGDNTDGPAAATTETTNDEGLSDTVGGISGAGILNAIGQIIVVIAACVVIKNGWRRKD